MLQRLNREKIVISGDRIRCYEFRGKKYRYLDTTPSGKATDGDKEEGNVFRARKKVRLLLETNVKVGRSWFLTMTFKENVGDWQKATEVWRSFARKLPGWFGEGTVYICVPEKQKRGAWHYHAVVVSSARSVSFEKIRISMLESWRRYGYGGTVRLEKVRCRRGISLYVSKYITKEMCENVPFGKRSYFASKNIKQPTIYGDKDIKLIRERCKKLRDKKPDFESEYTCRDGRYTKMKFYHKATISEVI